MSATALSEVALLERAIGYTSHALDLVRPDLLDRRTPCQDWDLRALLVHMDDSLAAFVEAGRLDVVGLAPSPCTPESALLVASLRGRACEALAAWRQHDEEGRVRIGDASLEAGLLAAAGALEIAVHGWDVAQSCGGTLPLPPALAEPLLTVAIHLVTGADRPGRFGAAGIPDDVGPEARLLAFLGR